VAWRHSTGSAPVLLDDKALAKTSSVQAAGPPDRAARGARLTQLSLPVEVVGALLHSKDQFVGRRAESYLLAEGQQSREELLWARHQNEAFVTGWREKSSSLEAIVSRAGQVRRELRAELFKDSPPLETSR